MTEHSLYSPEFGDFLDKYPNTYVKEKIFNHPDNDDPKILIKAILDAKAIKLGIQEKDFILAIYQYQYVKICSGNLDSDEWSNFMKSYNKQHDLPSIEIFKQATRDDFILTSLEKFFTKKLITDIYRKLSKTS